MSPRQPPPVDAMDLVEDLLATDELEELAKKPIAELDASIRKHGHDPLLADAIFERVLAERRAAALPPAANEAPDASSSPGPTEPPPPSKRAELARARTKRRSVVPWLLAAAMGGAVVDVALTQGGVLAAHFRPEAPPGPPAAPPSLQRTPEAIAVDVRAQALDHCAKQLFDVCAAELDHAKELDPAGENTAEVAKARAAIAAGADVRRFEGAKPGSGAPPLPETGIPSHKDGPASSR